MSLTAEQLAAHHAGLGGTDASVIAGCSPYKTARELFHEKRGEIVPEDISEKDAVHWGSVLEDTVAQEYARRTGHKVRRRNVTLVHPEHEFIIGHIDRDVVGVPRALECKTAGAYFKKGDWGPSGTDEVPEHYLLQVMHYMGLMPKVDVMDLAVLIGGRDFRIYEIGRDQDLIDDMFALEVDFWADVQAGVEPEFDFTNPSTAELLNTLYPGTNGEVISLPESSVNWLAVMDEARAKAKEYTAVVDGAKLHLKALMADAAVGLFPDGSGFTRKVIVKKPYEVAASSYVDFRFSKKPKGVSK